MAAHIPLAPVESSTEARIRTLAGDLKQQPGALLPILHAVQDTFGYVPECTAAVLATELALSRAEVHGVISFYHHFRTRPAGAHVLHICRAEACQSMGSAALERDIKQLLNIDYHQTTADGSVTLEPVYCLGNCACSPNIRLDDAVHGRMTLAKTERLLQLLKEGQA
ncbi:formate dehydrogenase subunit gamma [Pokkaliibacter plantistimulans]|uniref:formate dehydrogenase subunit gamma n=1 Tax=Pokkaliibacter plantistimulans TaxID=1635171 RepID=UPI000D748131|nr:formate dehydrogenase subunit gamma [Pokkaliibacter plantistimulans]